MIEMSRREQIGAMVLAGLLLAGLALRFVLLPQKPQPLVISAPEQPQAETPAEVVEIVVHVAGAVLQPGVYILPQGARVVDALAAAGGALPEAAPHALNLAEPLYDGRRISVPLAGEAAAGAAAAAAESGKININTASAGELEKLPGIGPAKAAAIVKHREQQGPFRTADDLTAVTGIGPKTVENLKEYITLY